MNDDDWMDELAEEVNSMDMDTVTLSTLLDAAEDYNAGVVIIEGKDDSGNPGPWNVIIIRGDKSAEMMAAIQSAIDVTEAKWLQDSSN